MRWIIDGWEHMTMLEGAINNYPSGLGMYTIDVEENRVYKALLEVEDNHVTTYIDGKKYCDHEAKNVIPESLYYSAVEDADAVMVKVANVEKESKDVVIQLENSTATEATLYIMEDYKLEDANSFDEPMKVSPKEKTVAVQNGRITYCMKPYSLAVFHIKRG
jgi:alpha-L-arabinofuranosidase